MIFSLDIPGWLQIICWLFLEFQLCQSIVCSGFWMCLYEQICFKRVAPTNSMSSTVILDVAGCWFHPRDPEKSTKLDFEHKNGNDTFVVVKLRSYSTKIKILQYESIFFSPKPISKLLVNLILFGACFFTNPHIILALSNDFLLHQKKTTRSNGYNFDPSYTATAQSGRGGNFALGYTGGNLIGASNVSPAVVRDVWTTNISADFFVQKKTKIDRCDGFLGSFLQVFWLQKVVWCGFLIAKENTGRLRKYTEMNKETSLKKRPWLGFLLSSFLPIFTMQQIGGHQRYSARTCWIVSKWLNMSMTCLECLWNIPSRKLRAKASEFFTIPNMGVSKNMGNRKSSIIIGFSFINHPFWGTPNFWKHPHGVMVSPSTTHFFKRTSGKLLNPVRVCFLWRCFFQNRPAELIKIKTIFTHVKTKVVSKWQKCGGWRWCFCVG